MANFIVIIVIVALLYLAIKPIIKFNKEKGSDYGCYKCSQGSDKKCSGCDKNK